LIVDDPGKLGPVEVAVIGSGPGGSVVAATLAAAGRNVLLIEEGQYLPQDSCVPFTFAEMRQKYRAGGITAAFGRPNVAYAEGSCVGGGSEVNSGLYHRTPDDVMAEWAQDFGVEDFTPASMERYFAACEAVMQPATYPDALPGSSKILRRGADAQSMASSDVPRLVVFGSERDEEGMPRTTRRSMTESFIPAFLEADGKLLPDTRVLKLSRRAQRWEIHARHARGRVKIEAEHVFVCGGAIHSPALLQRSGIRTNIGRSLSMQPMIKLTAEFPEPVNFPGMGIAGEQVKEFSPQYSFGCAISSRAHLAINLASEAGGPEYAIARQPHLISYYVMSSGGLDGSVRALPGFDDPLVSYKLSARERTNLGSGVKGLAGLLLAAGATQVNTGLREQPIIHSEQQLTKLPDSLGPATDSIMTIHLMASCPMGENQTRAAVDSWGQVHGHPGLYVADVSTLCTSPGVNPQGSIMAVAKRSAEHFLKV
jgi:choline dehydrogenase-like flavoprotein